MPERRDQPPGEPRRRATALRYEQGQRAPTVVATGTGLIAERIVEAAREAGVPVRSDAALAAALAQLDLGAEIPEPLYVAVAEVLAWAYTLDAGVAR
jgi:flagellar biosynthesis protein